eukprot:PhF_6_TR2701/c0_g1_i1/m.4437
MHKFSRILYTAPAKVPSGTAILTTTRDYISGTRITRELGVVVGNSVKTRNILLDIVMRLKGIVGGELTNYTVLMEQAASEATERMMREALELKANAVVRLRYQTSTMTDPVAGLVVSVMATGTAVEVVDNVTHAPPTIESGASSAAKQIDTTTP